MHKVKYLSYMLEKENPAYRRAKVFLKLKEISSLKRGDSCNTFKFSIENHWGTHIDAPAHFFNKAKRISDYSADELFFKKPCLIHLKPKISHIITLDEIKGQVDRKSDLILLKSGFSRFRRSKTYVFNNPGISPDIGLWLRKERPNVRAIGMDFISVSSYKNRPLGRKAHKAFLNPKASGKPILIIEDMDLSCDLSGLKKVLAAPLLIKDIDSAPCAVLGIFGKE